MNKLSRWVLGSDNGFLPTSHRATHTHVIGQPETGKSRTLESWEMQDIVAGHGVGVVDPHGDMFENLLARLAAIPEVWDKVIILDPCNPKWTVGFNPIAAVGGYSQERLSLFLTDVVVKIWKLDTANAPRLIRLLTHSFLALSNLGLTLLDLPRFLTDSAYRENLLLRLTHEIARAYFQFEFPKSQGAIHQWVTPLLNKIGGLIFDPDVRLMFSGEATIDFREVLDRRLILLVNLPKGIIGEGASALLGAFIVAHLQKAALSRADSRSRAPFYLYLDEFQNYTTDNIKDILSESRKYALSLTLAHQYLDQLSPDLRSAVLNTAGNLASFRVGYRDAQHLAREIFPSPDFRKTSKKKLKLERFGSWPLPMIEEERKPLGWDGLAQMLTQLSPRMFWFKRRGFITPAKQRSLDMPDPDYSPELLANMAKLLDVSGDRHGRLKRDARAILEASKQQDGYGFRGGWTVETPSEENNGQQPTTRKPIIREEAKASDN